MTEAKSTAYTHQFQGDHARVAAVVRPTDHIVIDAVQALQVIGPKGNADTSGNQLFTPVVLENTRK